MADNEPCMDEEGILWPSLDPGTWGTLLGSLAG